jgi:signal peptidase I
VRSLKPPMLAVWILEHLGPRHRRQALVGDCIEEFRRGRSKAWLWGQGLRVVGLAVASALHDRGRQLGASFASAASRQPAQVTPRFRRYWRDYRGIAAFLLLMLGFRSAWADWVYVPTGSMNPTILEGDRLFVDKHVYGLRVPFTLVHLTWGEDPVRGDIVIFPSPTDGTLLVKRVIAIPGDTVAMNGERLTVNGITARYAPGDARELQTLLAATQAQHPTVLRESGIGIAHDILLLPDRSAPSTFGPIVVPEGKYFVLGDNRDDSEDSRFIGLVPRRNIIGRATRVIVSLNPDRYYLPRSSRLLTPLH